MVLEWEGVRRAIHATQEQLADPKPADAKEPEADDPMKAMLEEAEKDAKKKKP